MVEHKRVRENGWEYSIPAARVTDGVEVVDKPALAPSGKPLPPKPVMAKGARAPGSREPRSTTTRAPRTAPQTSGAPASGDAGQTSAPH